MSAMEERGRRFGLGRILSTIGALWIGLFFLTRFGLFGANPFTTVILGMGAFLPIAMMFAGRVITRRGKRTEPADSEQVPEPPRHRQTRPPDPVTFTELAEAVTFDEVETPPESPPPESAPPEPMVVPSDTEIRMRTSAEMVADAKRALAPDA